jgi:hypothetical protein
MYMKKGLSNLYSIIIVFLICVLVILPTLSYAIGEINDLNLYVDNYEVEYINYKNPFVASLKFNIDTIEEIDFLIANLSSLNLMPSYNSQYSEIDFFSNNYCKKIEGNTTNENNETTYFLTGYDCEYPYMYVLMNNLSANISFFIDFKNNDVENIFVNKTLSFSLDDTKPNVTSIKTNFCEGDICYVSNLQTQIIAQIRDTIGTFNSKRVFFKIGNEPTTRFSNCTQNSCTRNSYVSTCSSNQRLEVKLVSSEGIQSSDDAGNVFVNNGKTNFVCDQYAPEISSDKINYTYVGSSYTLGKVPLKQKDTITFKINITDDASTIKAYANFKELNNDNKTIAGTCVKTSFGGTCTWYVTAVNSGDLYVYFNATDFVGHKSEIVSYRLHVDKFEDNESVPTPKYFKDTYAKSLAEGGYNRVVLGLMFKNGLDMPLYQTFKLDKLLSDSVTIIAYEDHIDTAYCQIDYLNGTIVNDATDFLLTVADPYLDWNEENRIDLRFYYKDPNGLKNRFDIVCNVSAYVRVNEDTYYSKPTQFRLVIPVQLRNSALGGQVPGEKLAERIKEKEDYFGDFFDFVNELDKWLSVVTELCNAHSMLTGINAMTTDVQIIGATLQGNGGDVMKFNAEKAKKSVQLPLNDGMFNIGDMSLGSIINKACQMAKCNVEEKFQENADKETKDQNFWTSTDTTGLAKYYEGNENAFYGDLFKDIERPNVKDSLISSVYLQCIPGMIYHINKYRQVECHELLCYKQNARMGLSIATCEEARSQYICESVVGEIFEIPGIRGAKNILDNANAMTQALIPKSLDYLLKNSFCKNYLGENAQYVLANKLTTVDKFALVLCYVPESVARVVETTYRTTAGTGSFIYPVQDDVCSLALCNKDNVDDCQDDKPDWFSGINEFNLFDYGTLQYKVDVEKPTVGQLLTTLDNARSPTNKDARDQLIRYGYDKNILKGTDQGTIENYIASQKLAIENAKNNKAMKDSDTVAFDRNNQINYHFTSTYALNKANQDYDAVAPLRGDEHVFIYSTDAVDLTKTPDAQRLISSNTDPKNPREINVESEEYKKLNSDNKLVVDTYNKNVKEYETALNAKETTQRTYINELNARIDTIQKSLNQPISDIQRRELVEQQRQLIDIVTIQNEITTVNNYIRDCGDSCTNLEMDIAKIELQDLEKSLANQVNQKAKYDQKVKETREVVNSIRDYTDKATQFAYKQGWLNWAKLSSFGHHTLLGSFSDWSSTYLSSDNMKDSICSPFFDFDSDSGEMQGSAVQCVEGTCRPVLTMASEKLKINDTAYLYTLSYYLGNVRRPVGIDKDEKILYNVFIKKSGVQKPWFNDTWMKLNYGERNNINYAYTRLIQDGGYTQICIKFKYTYPPEEITAKEEYCRDIKDSTTGDMDFDTGSFNKKYLDEIDKYNEPIDGSGYALSDV